MRKMKRLQGECRIGMLAYQYDRTVAPDAEGVNNSGLDWRGF